MDKLQARLKRPIVLSQGHLSRLFEERSIETNSRNSAQRDFLAVLGLLSPLVAERSIFSEETVDWSLGNFSTFVANCLTKVPTTQSHSIGLY